VAGLGILTAGALIFLSTVPQAGFVAPALRAALSFLVGRVGATLVALALIFAGMALLIRHQEFRSTRVTIGVGLLFWIFLGLSQIGAPGAGLWGRDYVREPGGLLGVALAEFVRPCFGNVLGSVVLVVGALCAIAFMSDVPLAILGQRAARALVLGLFAGLGTLFRPLRRRERARRLLHGQPPRALSKGPAGRRQAPTRPGLGSPSPPGPFAAGKAEPTPAAQSAPTPAPSAEAGGPFADFQLPPLSLLSSTPDRGGDAAETLDKMEMLERALASFGVEAEVVEVERGPRVTRYEIKPPPGVRVSRICSLADDLALALAALDVRVEAPVPGKGVIGIEVPNPEVVFVDLKDILASEAAEKTPSRLAFALGKDISGHPRMADLAKMPHLLIAGATNSGKSVCLNAMISSLLFRARPDEVKFLMIDPKRVELSLFDGIPNLAAPVAHDAKEAAGLLRWAIREMEHRYEVFAETGVRNIVAYNERAATDSDLDPLYYLVIVIDELADLMMQAATEFETSICRIAQLARATGIHLVVATQRPSVNVITGTIKANISSRIAFAVASQADSRVVLDINGAERLVGSGDMLFLPIDESKPIRIQGAYIREDDIVNVADYLKAQAEPQYLAEALASADGYHDAANPEEGQNDPLFEKALDFVQATKYASASMLQRKLRIGYPRAARLIDIMERRGYIGPADGSGPREVYTTPWDKNRREDNGEE
jgi:S-DNA-T family DNA segregation ATPase FtsK/SpoIIIE